MTHYIDILPQGKSIDTVILHVGLSDPLNGNSRFNADSLMSNVQKIIEKCKRVGVRTLFVSGLVYTTRVSLTMLERVHILTSNYGRENACFYIDNRNIREFFLCKDGFHLLESGKNVLASIFTVDLNKFFKKRTHTDHQYLFE